MNDELPPPLPGQAVMPPPVAVPPRLPPRRWVGPLGFLLIPVAAVIGLYLGPLRVEIHFTDDAGRVPGPFEVTLRSGATEKKVLAEKGRLHLLRSRWRELEVTDLSYVRSSHPVRGGKMQLTIERNTLLKLKQAAIGQPSVPQRGDPDPRDD